MKTLSIGGRLTLIKSVLASTPIYCMSMYKVPSRVLKCLEDIRHKFFIGADPKEKKMAWFKWSRVLASKDKGGLGVSSFFALNRALLFKWMWRFHNDRNALWSRFIRALHGNSGGIQTRSKVSYSSIWSSIVTDLNKLRNKDIDLLSFMNKRVGNGLETNFWEDVWMGVENFKTRFPRIYALESEKKIKVVAKMIHNDVGFSLRRLPRDEVEMEQFSSLTTVLDGVVLPEMNDRWFLDHSGFIKINILAWKVRFDFLLTRLNLSRRGIEIQSLCCPICFKEVDSTSHIFFTCPLVRDVYCKIVSWWELTYSEFVSYEDWSAWMLSLRISSNDKVMLEGIFYVTWWLVWNHRNKLLFDTKSPSKAIIFDELVSRSFYWCRYRCKASFSWLEWMKSLNRISL
ncbi:RNA-directed DNA polymerase, eukaryota, reverse transcriptase zinc-binding domain protein [Tanacetum coccineum]